MTWVLILLFPLIMIRQSRPDLTIVGILNSITNKKLHKFKKKETKLGFDAHHNETVLGYMKKQTAPVVCSFHV